MTTPETKLINKYRKAVWTKEGRHVNCKNCGYRKFYDHGYRCKIIGLQGSSKYRVEADHVCDSFSKMRVK